MKADVESELIRISGKIAQRKTPLDEREALTRRQKFLEMCLNQPVKRLSQIEYLSMIKLTYGTEDGKRPNNNINRCSSFDSCSFNC